MNRCENELHKSLTEIDSAILGSNAVNWDTPRTWKACDLDVQVTSDCWRLSGNWRMSCKPPLHKDYVLVDLLTTLKPHYHL